MGLSTTYTKTETDFLIQQKITTAYLGIATTTTTPPATGAYWYRVTTAGTYTNFKDSSNVAIVVIAADLDGNEVFIEVKDNVATKRIRKEKMPSSILSSLIKNHDFKDDFMFWVVNEPANISTSVSGNILSINTSGASNPAIYQSVTLNKGIYTFSIRLKNTTDAPKEVRIGILPLSKFTIPSGEFIIITDEVVVNESGSKLIMFSPPPNTTWEIDYFYLLDNNNVFTKNINKVNTPFFLSKTITITYENEVVSITSVPNTFLFDVSGGYRKLVTNITLDFSEVVYLSSAPDSYVEVDMTKKGTGENVYLWKERYDAKRTKPRENLIGINYHGWSPNHASLQKTSTSDYKKWFPNKSNTVSPFKSTLKPFIQKYYARTSDVTIVQIGDSISTDLNWTDKRPDANERPPFCTEYNVNSYLEEKLRWKEQKYRRFDYNGVFTETLGGGTSSVKEIDDKWGAVGGSFYYPITKVIDGGTNAGISFGFPANHKRLSLILHSDQLFATETKVTISSGNGKVEVWNGSSWVEANNYTTSFRETSDQIIGAVTSFYMDNAQKRLKFRSLSDLSAKTITVQNVGVGRFGYWGIEYSPNDYLFTYICASKGSHGITKLQQFETWMVDSFNPDLVLWQMPILNQGFGVAIRGWDSSGFNVQFKNKFDALKAKGYLVLPYILWGATTSGFVDTNGNFLSGLVNGKIVSPFADVANIMSVFSSNDYPIINLFDRITEVAQEKAKLEGGNVYSKALVGSGKNGETFTVDGIHMNKLGNEVVFNLLEPYFNF